MRIRWLRELDNFENIPAPMELRKVTPLRKKTIKSALVRETMGFTHEPLSCT